MTSKVQLPIKSDLPNLSVKKFRIELFFLDPTYLKIKRETRRKIKKIIKSMGNKYLKFII